MIRWISNLIALQEKRSFHGETVVLFAIFVGSMRFFMEVFLVGFHGRPVVQNELMYVSWYLMCFFIFGLPVRFLAPPPWERRINVMLVGLFLGFMPPVIDVIASGWGDTVMGYKGFNYAYIKNFPEGWPWLMIDPKRRMPVGEGAVLWLAVLFTGTYMALRTRSAWRTLLSLVMAYLACVFVGAIMPTALSMIRDELWPGRSLDWSIVFGQVALTLFVYLVFYRTSLLALVVKRFVHALPLLGMALVGWSWIKRVDVMVLESLALVSLSGVLTIVQNDHWDDAEEMAGQPERVTRYDVVIIQSLWMMVVLALYAMESHLAIIMTVYGVASYLYNAPLYRGKRYFPANLKLEGLWGGAAFAMGVFAAAMPELLEAAAQRSFASRIQPWMTSMPLSWRYGGDVAIAALLAFGGWSVLASLKDEKDVESDSSTGVQTVFTLLIRRGWSPDKVSKSVRAMAFVCLAIAAWAPLLIHRSSWTHGLVLTALGVVIATLQLANKTREFRVVLVILTTHLVVLAHGLSTSHG